MRLLGKVFRQEATSTTTGIDISLNAIELCGGCCNGQPVGSNSKFIDVEVKGIVNFI